MKKKKPLPPNHCKQKILAKQNNCGIFRAVRAEGCGEFPL